MYDRRNRNMPHRRGEHIFYSAEATGKARIICDEEKTKLEGILVGEDDEVFSFRCYYDAASKQVPTTSSMTVFVFDSETGHEYKVENVKFCLEIDPETTHRKMTLEHQSLQFRSTDWYQGNRADVEIRTYMDPRMVECGSDVFVGQMTIRLLSTCKSSPLNRRISTSDDANTVVLEMSNDFLA